MKLFTRRIAKMDILRMFSIKSSVRENINDCILVFKVMDVVRLRINNKRYADAEMQAGIISMSVSELIIIKFCIKVT